MEKQKTFIDRLEEDGEDFGAGLAFATNKVCKTCMLRYKNIFLDGEDRGYKKCHCKIYEEDEGEDKPNDVAYDGADCEYYVEE